MNGQVVARAGAWSSVGPSLDLRFRGPNRKFCAHCEPYPFEPIRRQWNACSINYRSYSETPGTVLCTTCQERSLAGGKQGSAMLAREEPPNRNCLGVMPHQRLNACVKELTSR